MIDGTQPLPALGAAILEAEKARRTTMPKYLVGINPTRLRIAAIDATKRLMEGRWTVHVSCSEGNQILVALAPGGLSRFVPDPQHPNTMLLRSSTYTRDGDIPYFAPTQARVSFDGDAGGMVFQLPTERTPPFTRGPYKPRKVVPQPEVASAEISEEQFAAAVRLVNQYRDAHPDVTLNTREGKLLATVAREYV